MKAAPDARRLGADEARFRSDVRAREIPGNASTLLIWFG